MVIVAEMVLHPGGIVAWLAVGLIAGWLATKLVGGASSGLIYDMVLGLLGAVIGGFLFGYLQGTDMSAWDNPGFWGSVVVAFLGACVLLVAGRFLGLRRRV